MEGIMQVKRYNRTIAISQYQRAIRRFIERGYGYSPKSMFYFMLDDNETERKKGWVVYDNHGAKWFKNKQQAIAGFYK